MYSIEQVQKAMDRIAGVENAACITFEHFSALLRENMNSALEARMLQRLRLFDADGSGEISLAELKKCIQAMDDLVTSAEVEELLKVCDGDQNGEVSRVLCDVATGCRQPSKATGGLLLH